MTKEVMFGAKIYLDSNVLISAVEGELNGPEQRTERTREFLKLTQGKPGCLVTSELTIAEVLAPVQRSGVLPYGIRSRLYFNLLVWNESFDLMKVTRELLVETARFRNDLVKKKKMKLPDAIHLTSAIRARCGYFVSSDKDIPVPRGMKKIPYTSSGLRQLTELLQ